MGYVPAAYLMVILDETQHEEESRKEGHDKRIDGTKIGGEMGQDGERRKTYSAAVIDGCERPSTIYVGDSIVRQTDISLNKGKDVVVCLPGARIEHVTERVKKIMGRGNGGSIVVHVGTNNADREGTTAILEKYRDLLKKTKQARVGQIIISGILPVFGNKIQGYRNSKRKFEADGSQRDGEAALQGRGCGIHGFVGQLCGERRHVRARWPASEWKGGSSFCRGTVRGGRQWLG